MLLADDENTSPTSEAEDESSLVISYGYEQQFKIKWCRKYHFLCQICLIPEEEQLKYAIALAFRNSPNIKANYGKHIATSDSIDVVPGTGDSRIEDFHHMQGTTILDDDLIDIHLSMLLRFFRVHINSYITILLNSNINILLASFVAFLPETCVLSLKIRQVFKLAQKDVVWEFSN